MQERKKKAKRSINCTSLGWMTICGMPRFQKRAAKSDETKNTRCLYLLRRMRWLDRSRTVVSQRIRHWLLRWRLPAGKNDRTTNRNRQWWHRWGRISNATGSRWRCFQRRMHILLPKTSRKRSLPKVEERSWLIVATFDREVEKSTQSLWPKQG